MEKKKTRETKPMALIEWVDASIWGSNSVNEEDARKMGLTHGYACGFVIEDDEEKIIIAMDWFDENKDFRCINSYPKSGIKKIKYFSLSKRID